MNLVRENMKDDFLSNYVKALMLNELAMALPENITENQYTSFGNDVLSRFSNPFINHKLLDITVQYTAKMVMRNIPLLLTYHQRYGKTPPLFALGFAAYLRFMKADFTENGKYFGKRGEENYPINCDAAPYFYQSWKENPASKDLVHIVLSNKELWGTDLTEINGFEALVLQNLEGLN